MLHLLLPALPCVAWGLFIGLAWFWLRQAITPEWVAQLFESEGKPSIRKVGFFIVIVAVLRFAAVWAAPVLDALLVFASSLVIAGTAKTTISRFAPKPKVDPTEQSKQTVE